MIAKQCDRCESFFKEETPVEDELRLYTVSNTKSKYSKRVDLCPECEKSLEEWFKVIKEVK